MLRESSALLSLVLIALCGIALPSEGEFHDRWIHRLYEEPGDPVFARTMHINQGRVQMANIPPGRYRTELMESEGFLDPWSIGLSGKHSKKFAEFEVHADGTTTPAKLVF